MKLKTLDDVMICPCCQSQNCYEYNTDEIEFNENGNGHYYVDCYCVDCKKNFRLCVNFDYFITQSYIRN